MNIRSKATLVVVALSVALSLSLALAAGLSGGHAYRYISVFQEVLNLTRANYVEKVDERALLEGAYRGMLSSLDAASAYLGQDEGAEVLEPAGPGRLGLAVLPSGGVAVVVRVDEGSPADEAGIETGDQIWRIGDRGTRQLSWPQLQHMLTGEPGESVEITLLDGRTFRVRDETLTLATPADPGFKSEVRDEAIYLRVAEPERIEAARLAAALNESREAAPRRPLLVDLRGVVGLDLEGALAGLSPLLPSEPLLRIESRRGATTRLRAPLGPRVDTGPLFVLVDGTTAGVGEALAAGLDETRAARTCGRETFGLGALPELITLESGDRILLTTRLVRTSEGRAWAGEGLEPERPLRPDPTRRAADEDADSLLELCLEWIAAGAPAEGEEDEREAEPAA